MSYIRGEGRSQGTLFPVVLDDLVPKQQKGALSRERPSTFTYTSQKPEFRNRLQAGLKD